MIYALKSCPFCGSITAPEIEIPFEDNGDYLEQNRCVVCNFNNGGCGASGGVRDSEEKAVAAWNDRKGLYAKPEDLNWHEEEMAE